MMGLISSPLPTKNTKKLLNIGRKIIATERVKAGETLNNKSLPFIFTHRKDIIDPPC